MGDKMSDFSGEKVVDFWKRPEQQSSLEQIGPFKEPIDKLCEAMESYRKQLETDVIDGDSVLRSPDVEFWYDRSSVSARTKAKAFAFNDKKTGDTYLAVDDDMSTADMFRFKVDESGILVNIDNTVDHFGESPDDVRLITQAVDQISRSLFQRDQQERTRREELKTKVKQWAGGITSLAVIAGGVAYGLEKLYFEPHARAEAALKAYDNEHHVLPVEGIIPQSQKISVMSGASFNDIPDYKKHDNLRSPRTIEIKGNSCEVEAVTSHPGDSLRIALKDGDPLIGSTVGASVDSARKHVTICLMGPASPGQDSKSGPDKSKLAIQLTPAVG